MRFIPLLATSLLAHLPLQLGDAEGNAFATHEANWRIANLLSCGYKHLKLSVEPPGLAKGGAHLVHQDITRTRHAVHIQPFDVLTPRRSGENDALMVPLKGEIFLVQGLLLVWVGTKTTSSPGLTVLADAPASTTPPFRSSECQR